MKLSAAQIAALKHLPTEGECLTEGNFGNNCSMLFKKGLVEFRGFKNGKRVFAMNDAGRAAISQDKRG
jgi:hypothetical protein